MAFSTSNQNEYFMKNVLKLCLLISTILLATSCQVRGQANYSLVRKTIIGGEGGWDYLTVDVEGRRLFVSHGNQVEVLDIKTHKKLGTITGTPGIHGIAIVSKAGRGVTTNGRANTATLFDLKTLDKIAELPTGKNPDALLYDTFSDKVFIFNHSGGSATAIDVTSAKVTGTIELGGEGVEAGVSDGKGTIYVNLEDTHEIVAFDAKALVIKHRWSIAPGEEPTGLAYNPKTNRLFSVCHNELMMVVDSNTGEIIAKVPIGKRVDGAVFDPASKRIFSSNGEGSISVVEEISENEYRLVQTIETVRGARTITIDPKTHHVFLSTAEYGPAPAATSDNPNPRPTIVPGTFMILEYGQK